MKQIDLSIFDKLAEKETDTGNNGNKQDTQFIYNAEEMQALNDTDTDSLIAKQLFDVTDDKKTTKPSNEVEDIKRELAVLEETLYSKYEIYRDGTVKPSEAEKAELVSFYKMVKNLKKTLKEM